MSADTINIYMDPDAELDRYPDDLYGDMSVFKDPRIMQYEVQWVLYLLLKNQGMDVQVCQAYPDEGIILIPKSDVKGFVWKPNLYVVSLQYDYRRDDRAQMHVVSNEFKATKAALGILDRVSFAGLQYYVPSVMHSVIIPRDPARGDRFENLVFIGAAKNLDDAFKTPAFQDEVRALGMKFTIVDDPEMQPDYSTFDVVMAIRKLGQVISNKPPVKLINAWRGGVPAILGKEIGFIESRENEYDFIEVDSVDETVEALKRLKDDVGLRHKMVDNGKVRAVPYTAEGQRKIWVEFVRDKVLPASDAWRKQPVWLKYSFLSVRWIRHMLRKGMSFLWHRVLRRGYNDYT